MGAPTTGSASTPVFIVQRPRRPWRGLSLSDARALKAVMVSVGASTSLAVNRRANGARAVVSPAAFYRASVRRAENTRRPPALNKRTRGKVAVSLAAQVSARGPCPPALMAHHDYTGGRLRPFSTAAKRGSRRNESSAAAVFKLIRPGSRVATAWSSCASGETDLASHRVEGGELICHVAIVESLERGYGAAFGRGL